MGVFLLFDTNLTFWATCRYQKNKNINLLSPCLMDAVSHTYLHPSLMSRGLQMAGPLRRTHHRLLGERRLWNVGHWWMCARWDSFRDSKPLWSGCRHTEKKVLQHLNAIAFPPLRIRKEMNPSLLLKLKSKISLRVYTSPPSLLGLSLGTF